MSDMKKTTEQMTEKTGDTLKKGKRYQGYDLDAALQSRSGKKKPWFWKILGISLLITAFLILVVCGYIFGSKKKMTEHISKINQVNTMDALLDGHQNVLITTSYSHLAEEEDYTGTRFVKKTKDGDYYSYYKTEGKEEDYKEVIRDQKLYRYDEKFVYFYGLIGNDYEDTCVSEIENAVYQASDSEKIEKETESGNFVKINSTYEVTDGDSYNTKYGFEVGDKIEKVLTIDKDSLLVLNAIESCNGEEFFSYTVEFDGKDKVPQFYQDLKNKETERECTVYDDYDGDQEKKYTFDIPSGVYFTLLDHEGYKVYSDKDCEKEFTKYQMQVQNPESDLTLYVKQESK